MDDSPSPDPCNIGHEDSRVEKEGGGVEGKGEEGGGKIKRGGILVNICNSH